jgi:hypothetical protein
MPLNPFSMIAFRYGFIWLVNYFRLLITKKQFRLLPELSQRV